MTNPDQDVTLDEMAEEVVEWMDGWEMLDNYHITHKEKSLFALTVDELKESLDVIREVEQAVKQENFWPTYTEKLMVATGYRAGSSQNMAKFGLATADPETRLRAIYATLRESSEI